MKKFFEDSLKKTIVFIFLVFVIGLGFSVETEAAMSVNEMKQRLTSYSDCKISSNEGILYLEHTKWNVTEDEMFKVINDVTGYLMGDPVEDYCKVQLKFFYTDAPYGKNFETFSKEVFKFKSRLTSFWGDWSRYNSLAMSATPYNDVCDIFSVNITIELNGDSSSSSGEKYNEKLLEIVTDAHKVCTNQMEYVCYYLRWLDENVKYVYLTKYTNDPYYALIIGKTVCGGYANAFKDLCNATGIPAIIAVNESKNHAWSEVCVDGIWYTADLCNVVKPRSGEYINTYLFKDPNLSKDNFSFIEGKKAAYADFFDGRTEINISTCQISLSSSVDYTGKAVTPAVTVKSSGKALTKGKDYTLTYSSNILPGTAKVTVKAVSGSGYKGSVSKSYSIVIPKTKVSYSPTSSSAKLTWTKVNAATGYIVEKYDSSTKKYVSLKVTSALSFEVKKLPSGKPLTVSVTPYVRASGKVYKGTATKIVVLTKPGQVKSLKASNIKDKTLKLSWKGVSGAGKYRIYVSTDGKNWKMRKELKDTQYSFKALSANKKYYFKVCAVNSSGRGKFSSSITLKTRLAPVNFKLSASKGVVTVSWEGVKGADGYAIYYSLDKDMKDMKKIVIKDKKTLTKKVKELERIKIYYFKVRAFRVENGKRVYGTFSDAKRIFV